MSGIDAIQQALDDMRGDAIAPAAFCSRARTLAPALGLPPRYGEVLEGLLDRLEASALFTEESCSFSQRDLVDALQTWVDKARAAAR